MKKLLMLSTLAVLAIAAAPAHAATATYQVTGPVLSVSPTDIVVQKGKEKWDIAVGSVAMPAGVQVGSKVTVEYSMTAATITSKDKPAAPVANASPSKKEKAMKPASSAAASPVSAPAAAPAAPASAAMAPAAPATH